MRRTQQNMTEHATYVTELDGTCDVCDGTWQNMRCMGRNMICMGRNGGNTGGTWGNMYMGEHGWDGPVIEATSGKTRDEPIAALV